MIRNLLVVLARFAVAFTLIGCSQIVSSGVDATDAGFSTDRETSVPTDLSRGVDTPVDVVPVDAAPVDVDPVDVVPDGERPINLADDQRLFLFPKATVVRMPDGRVYGWGNGLAEALEDGTIPSSPPDAPPRGIVSVSLDFDRYRYAFGQHFTCRAERMGARAVSCRGTNENGAVGVLADAGPAHYLDWQFLPNMTNVRALAAERNFVCAWNESTWCWGHVFEGFPEERIGRIPVLFRFPVPRVVISQWGTYPLCVTTTDGILYCIGDGGYVSDPSGMVSGVPWRGEFVRIDGVRNVDWVSNTLTPSGTFMIDGDGALWCIGLCRDFTTVTPRRYEGLPPLRQIVEMRGARYALTRDGRLLSSGNCTGFNVSDYCLSYSRRPDVERPFERVTGVGEVTEIATSGEHACLLNRDGELWCWGTNDEYQITNASRDGFLVPTRIPLP